MDQKAYLISILPKQSFNFMVQKDYIDKIENVIEKFDNNYFSTAQVQELKWKLRGSNKTINSYNCKNAEVVFGGRKWIAWYTSDIPINDGPYKFWGLPGLILEIRSEDDDYSFVFKSFVKIDDMHFKLPTNLNKISLEKKINLKRNFVKSPSHSTRQEDLIGGFNDGAIINGVKYSAEESYKLLDQELWDWMKEHNNPIEKGNVWVR